MLREMSYSSLPQDETSASDRASFITQELLEYSPRSAASNQKIVCFLVSALLIIGASMAIIIPLLLDGPSNNAEGDDGFPLSSHLNSNQGLSIVSNILKTGGQNESNEDNSTQKDVLTNSDEHQNKSNTENDKYTTREEEISGNPKDDQTWKVVNTESRNNSGLGGMNVTTISGVQLNATVTIGANGQVNGTTATGKIEVTTQPQQPPTTKPFEKPVTDYIAPEFIPDHKGSPWEQYQNDSSYQDTQKTSVISSLDTMTIVVLVALIAVSLSTLVAALAFLIHVKLETRKRRRNIANVITDLQSPDKIILLNSDESANSEESDEEYQRN